MEAPSQPEIPQDMDLLILEENPDEDIHRPPVCPICDTNLPESSFFTFKNCGHKFCKGCLEEHCTVSLHSNQIPITCPKYHCQKEIVTSDLKKLMRKERFDKAVRFTMKKKNPNLRECPSCNLLNEYTGTTPSIPILECHSCQTRYCLHHATAHSPAQTCYDYEVQKSSSKEEQLSEEFLRNFKKCPNCSRRIELISGTCDHVKCPCGTKFCYRCGISDWKGKFSPKCNRCGTSYLDHDYFWIWFLILFFSFPIWFPVALLFSCCIGCGLSCFVNSSEELDWTCFWKICCCYFIACGLFGHCVSLDENAKITVCCGSECSPSI